ncbi:MAG: error-prone DNA polymerase [Dehalococcoidia bacterium]|nr:error-prone DNA polymerase [Dehalococcoidia bacterium]
MRYVELHCHSCYSLREGASTPEELALRARELGYDALALTDHDGLYGAMAFAQTAKAFGVRPIIGAEVTLKATGVQGAEPHVGESEGCPLRPTHLTLLCESQRGYANLCRLLTHAHLSNRRGEPALDFATLSQHSEGLIALSGCKKGEVPSLVAEGRYREAEEVARRYSTVFCKDSFWIELQNNLVYGDRDRNRALVELAKRLGVGCVATNNVHYHVRERHRLQDVLVAIRHRTTLDASHRERRENSEYYLKPPDEMAALFAEYPEALANSVRIAERCRFDITRDLGYRFPDYPVPEGETVDSHLERVCYEAARERYAVPAGRQGRIAPEVDARLREELALVRKRGLSGFFLVYRRLLEMAREEAAKVRGASPRSTAGLPPGRGRGSSVSSLICYLIGLSHVDPLRYNLFFGRFLNEDGTSVPDIDLDFARDIREALILRVHEEFGPDHAPLVGEIITYKIRSAVRDVGKALGLPEPELDKLAKRVDGRRARHLAEEMSALPEFRRKLNAPLWRDLVTLAAEIDGLPRHLSQHVGGMIISSEPVAEIVPIEQGGMAGRYVCQWDKDSVDDAGMIKVDFLALGMLSLVEECVELIAERRGRCLDLSRIDYADDAVYDMICAADTIGVFQIESRAQMQLLPRTRPRSLEELTQEVAIVRPGPIVGKAVHPFVRRKQGREPVTYDHPSLEEALKDTFGVIIYQDQVLQVAMALAGFTAGQAEALRRAISRKRSREAMQAFWQQFREGALARGVDERTAAAVFEKLLGFAEYGFPKSHAAAFAVLAYQSSWLKKYYPAEFYCALFNAQPMGFYPPHVFTNDAKRHGVSILNPDINLSGARCTVEDGPEGDAVRIGIGYVRGIGGKAAQAVEEERRRNGPYGSVWELMNRTRLPRAAVEDLASVGAFETLAANRRQPMWEAGLVVRPREGRQLPLSLPIEQDTVELSDMTAWERMAAEYVNLGLSPTHHPLAFIRRALHEGVVSSKHLDSLSDGSMVELAGLVVCRQHPMTAKGFVFLLLEDEFGLSNVIVKPQLYNECRDIIKTEPLLLVRGRLQRKEGITNILAVTFRPLKVAASLITPPAHNFR